MKRFLLATILLGFLPTFTACAVTRSESDMARGVALYRDGRYDAALMAFDNAVGQSPESPAAYNNRAVARVRVGQLVGALGDYTRAIELAPTDPELYFNRGDAYTALGNYDYAIKDFNRAVELAPGYAKAYFNRGAARLSAGDRAGAMADWRYAIDTEPDPRAKAAMVRSAGLGGQAVSGSLTPTPGVGTVTVVPPPEPQPAASPAFDNRPTGIPQTEGMMVDARALATRAISRELDGDHAGAISDLSAALAIETDPARRGNLERLLRAVETAR